MCMLPSSAAKTIIRLKQHFSLSCSQRILPCVCLCVCACVDVLRGDLRGGDVVCCAVLDAKLLEENTDL